MHSTPTGAQTAVQGAIVPHAVATIGACLFVALCEGFDLQAAGVAAPGIAGELRPTPEQLGNFFSASTLGLLVGALIGGRLSDSFGRRPILLASVVIFAMFSILTATAHSIDSLYWARLLTGAGLGGALPNVLALVNESSSPGRRNANVTLVYGGMPVGGAAASLISMLIAPEQWRVIFLVGGLAPLLLVPLLMWGLRDAGQPGRAKDIADIAAPGSPAIALSGGDLTRAGSFGAIFTNGRAGATILLWISSLLELLILYLLLSWLPILLAGNGFSKSEAAGCQIVFNLGGAVSALLIGQLLEGRARNPSMIVAMIGLPVFVALLGNAPGQLSIIMLIVLGLGVTIVAAQGFLYATAPRCYPMAIRGIGVGATIAMGRLGSVIGPKLGGMLNGAHPPSARTLIAILPLVILGSITTLLLAWLTAKWRDQATVA